MWFLRYARTLLAFYQCGLNSSAIDESSRSLESIDNRLYPYFFCDKNDVFEPYDNNKVLDLILVFQECIDQ